MSIVHILYELWAKPNGATKPIAAMILVALGSPLRVLGGVLSVSEPLSPRDVLLIASFLFLGIGYVANFWRVEAEHVGAQKSPISPRPQSQYFYQNGKPWQHFGFSGMVVGTIVLVIDSLLCSRGHVCLNNVMVFQQLSFAVSSELALGIGLSTAIAVMLTVTWIVWKPLTNMLLCFHERPWITKSIVLALLLLPLLYFANFNREIICASFMFVFSVVAFSVFEDMDYNRYMFVHLRKNLKMIGHLWFVYLSNANSRISLHG
jgi:hypothetical protein